MRFLIKMDSKTNTKLLKITSYPLESPLSPQAKKSKIKLFSWIWHIEKLIRWLFTKTLEWTLNQIR